MHEPEEHTHDQPAIREALWRQENDPEYHDLTLIVQSLSQTPLERLAANEAFVDFLLSVRPEGPLVD